MKNPAHKGAEQERAQAKLLSLWISDGECSDLLWRTGMSGGRHTIGALKDVGYGDLQVLKPTPVSQRFMSTFCVEIKHYKTFELLSEWYNPKSNLKSWWLKVKMEAVNNKVQPMLIVKPNRKAALILFDKEMLYKKCSHYALSLMDRHFELVFGDDHVIGYVQDEFLSTVSFEDFRQRRAF